MKDFKNPLVEETVEAYQKVMAAGLKNIWIRNLGVFASTKLDQRYLMANVDRGAY